MAVERLDCIVVGAGPCGAIAARRLARGGRHVLLVDRSVFPRDKVCGCCLNEAALDLLAREGVLDAAVPSDAPTTRTLRLRHRGRSGTISLRPGKAVSRRDLDSRLVDAARTAGAKFMPGVSASLVHPAEAGARHTLHVRIGTDYVFTRSVIVADGLGGLFLPDIQPWKPEIAAESRMGLGASLCADSVDIDFGEIDMSIDSRGYVGLVRLADGSVDLAAAVEPAAVRRAGGPGELISQILTSANPARRVTLEKIAVRGTPRLTRRRRAVEYEGIYIAGDAARYVEPFTGEGMSWALFSGLRAAEGVERWLRNPGTHAGWYTRQLRTGLRARRTACAALCGVLRHGWSTAAAMKVISVVPPLAQKAGSLIGARFESGVHAGP